MENLTTITGRAHTVTFDDGSEYRKARAVVDAETAEQHRTTCSTVVPTMPLGVVFPGPDGEGFGYVTTDGTESPMWFGDDDTARAALASRGSRGCVGKGRPSTRWAIVLDLLERRTKKGITIDDCLSAFDKAGAPPVLNRAEVGRIIRAVRRRHGLTVTFDRKAGTYTMMAAS